MSQQYTKEIRFDRETRDFAMYLNGDLAGFAPTYREAEAALDALVYALLTEAAPPAPAALAERDPAFVVTSSARHLVHDANTYADAQAAARALAESEAIYLAGTPHWHSVMVVERAHNAEGNCTGYRVLRRPTGRLAAYITPTEVVATADIAGDFAAVQAERDAEALRVQTEQVRQWLAEGFEVPAHYPVQPGDLPEHQAAADVAQAAPAGAPAAEAPGPVSSDLSATSAPQEPAQRAVDAVDIEPLAGALVAAAAAADGAAPEWRNAIGKAFEWLLDQERVEVVDDAVLINGYGVRAGGCDCIAAGYGRPCYHRAARQLLARALEIVRAEPPAQLAA